MGSTVRLRLPGCGAFWFLRLVYFLSLLPVTPGAPEYWLFDPCASSVLLFSDTPPGLLCVHLCLAWGKLVRPPPSVQLTVILAFG